MQRLLIFLFLLPWWNGLSGQDTTDQGKAWSLRECINYAQEHNIELRKNELQVERTFIDHQQTKYNLLPDLNGFASHGYNWGQTIDQFTNTFATERVRNNSFSLSSSITLFNGLRQYNDIKRSEYELQSGRYNIQKMKDDLAMNIATTYLQVLFSKELVQNAEQQVAISRLQVERMQKLEKAGQRAKGDLLDMESQLENEKLNLVKAENDLQLTRLRLTQLLQLTGTEAQEFRIEEPELKDEMLPGQLKDRPQQVYEQALATMPAVKGAEAGIKSSAKQVAMAQGSRSPVLTVSGSYGTGYSGARKEAVGTPEIDGYDTLGFTVPSGEVVAVPSYEEPETQTIAFGEQFTDNLNQTLTFRLTLPIFTRMSTHNSIQKAKLARQQAELELESVKNSLRQDIRQAYNDALAARRKFQAAQKAVEAMEESFRYSEMRYEQGLITTVEYTDAKTNLAKARSDLLQAKYDHLFKTRILKFYKGEPLTFQ